MEENENGTKTSTTSTRSQRTFRTQQGMECQSSKPHKTAEDLAAESLAADMDKWVIYNVNDKEQREESLEEWLELYRPSKTFRDDGIGWISVRGKAEIDECDDPSDLIGLGKAWEDLLASEAAVSYDVIRQLALGYNVTTGKWLFHVPTGHKVDLLWKMIATEVVNDNMGGFAISAKVSPCNPAEPTHVICVYNTNYTNEVEVFALEKAIRSSGVKCLMNYKPDVYTHCGIYRKNKWELRPTVYTSRYDLRTQQSHVKECHNDNLVKSYSTVAKKNCV